MNAIQLFSFLKFYSKKILSDTVNSTVENPFLMIPYAPDFKENLSQCVSFFFPTFTNLSFLLTLKAKRVRTFFFLRYLFGCNRSLLQHAISLVVGHVRYSSPTRDGNRTLPWEHGVLATGLSGMSP